jgi:hypothetical protein
MTSEFNFEVRQIKLQISSSLQRKRHFCFDANPYAIRRWGLRRNRNVRAAASSDLSHFELESTTPNTALEPTPITPISFRCGFRVGGSHRRRGSALERYTPRWSPYGLAHLQFGKNLYRKRLLCFAIRNRSISIR